ncbi:hypothetical protein, partial [Roseibium sp. SCP14]|uniref:hypothetical protein n=1 Tax=Roseibium sp. SCP14 TaxID=3141375 RepID=UPI00333D6192
FAVHDKGEARSAIEQREHKSPLTKPNYKKSPHGENQRTFWRSKLKIKQRSVEDTEFCPY